jgi:hypothetical protein
MKVVGWIFATICAFFVVSLLISGSTFCGESAIMAKVGQDMREIAKAAIVYASNHQGRLPASLSELHPKHLRNADLLTDVQFTTPGAILDDLPPNTVIMFLVTSEDGWLGKTKVVAVYSDGRVEANHLTEMQRSLKATNYDLQRPPGLTASDRRMLPNGAEVFCVGTLGAAVIVLARSPGRREKGERVG